MDRPRLPVALLTTMLALPATAQFLPPGLPHPDNGGEDVMADHVVDGVNIHLVWASNVNYTGSAGNDPDIIYIRFDGSTWSAPILVNSGGSVDNGAGTIDERPRLALGPDGVLHCVWQSRVPPGTEWNVNYSYRPSGGGWQDAEYPEIGRSSDGVSDIEPNVIARANGDPLVVWQAWQQPGVPEELLFYAIRSSSGWTPSTTIGPSGSGEDFGPAALARAGNGTIVAAFSTTRGLTGAGADSDIAYSLFPPSGGWTAIAAATQLAVGDSGNDHDPALALLGSGDPGDFEVHVAWASTNDVNGNGTEGDILATVIQIPAAAPPTNAAFVVNSNAVGDAHPDDRPALCVEPGGVVHAAWQTRDAFFSDLDLLHATNATPGGDWSPFDLMNFNGLGADGDDQRVDIECAEGGILSGLWQSTDDLGGTVGADHDLFHALGLGRLVSRPEPINVGATGDSGTDFSLDLATGPAGIVHAAWVSDDPLIGGGTGPDRDIFYARRESSGWTAAQVVNASGATDSTLQGIPSIAVGPDGRVHVAWNSEENVGGDTGNDLDIFYSVLDAGVWSMPELVNSYGRTDGGEDSWPRLTLDGQGGVQAIWEPFSAPDIHIYWSRRTVTGWLPAEVASGAAVPQSFGYFCSVVDPSGVPHVVWSSRSDFAGTGPDPDLFYANRAGGTWSLPELVNAWGTTDGGADESGCALARLPNGDLQVVWSSEFDPGGTGADADLFTARRTASGWSAPALVLAAFATDTRFEDRPMAVQVGNTLHLTWRSQEVNFPTTFDYAQLDLTGSLPSTPIVVQANPNAYAAGGGPLDTMALGDDGVLHFGFSSVEDFGGTLGTDSDVLHTWTTAFDPLIFADGYESPGAE